MPDAAGNELELLLNVEIAGTYEFELGYTTAPDYGTFDLYLDGEKRGSIDGYGEVDAHTVLLSEVTLAEGEHRLKLVVTGKNEASANLALGLDHVFFRGDVSLAQYQLAAAKALKAYKSSENYSSEQWALVEAELARQIEAINACTTVEEVLAAWTTGKAKLDAIESGYYDYDHPKFDETKTPADFGWRTDGDNYTNWQVAAEGEPLCVRYTGKDSKRIWKQLIQNPDNFTVKLTAKVVDLRAAIEIMGVSIELNCENGNGNQIFDREGWQWFDAKHQLCEVTISRTDGGDLTITLKGAGNSTPVIYAKTPVNPADKNVYLGVLDAGGSAFFSDVTAGGEAPEEPIEGESPDEFGWDTDEPKDFSGWTATDAANVAAVYDKTTGNHRIWKGLLTNQKDFTAELDITTNNKSSAYVKVLGVTLELDSRGGDGNQSFVKLNGRNHDWVKGEACEMHVKLERKDGGNLTVIVTGKNGDKMELSAAPTEENENLELGLYAGTAKYESIAVTCKDIEPTTFLVTFVDGLTGETIAVRTVETGEAATAPAAPEHEGYTFKGWDKAFDNVTENLTVTALYEKNPVEYTVTFVDGLTKETIATVKVEESKAATAPAAPEHEGYTFKGWDKAFDNVTENLTVTALYEKNPVEYTVTFVDGLTKETIATVKVEESKAATAPAAPEHEGYTFKGWDKAFDNVTENLTVTAIYEKNAEPAKPWVNPFKDVKSSDWFYEGVKFANQQELFNGTAPDTFSPDDAMTRAMLVTVLWRLDGKTAATKASNPTGSATRAQVATILARYAQNIVK